MSDQDFFFDEEESETPKKAEKKAASARPAQKTVAPAKQQVFQQSVSMTVAALVAVIALLLGVIIGILIPTGGSGTTTDTGAVAPQLTPEQLQSGQLPPGHPDISGMTGGQAATGTSQPATGTGTSGTGN
ncbi:hypothetical protein MX659_06930 [Coriobacteriia bacterium Es71-Z0120]|uniref:hypothetical protein n=1 Tax=Parvivirga hydrogeniphila TaxID=2939460 RepID=UPI002260C2A2|nr:hypothetical protein [Parvivirga hydrogeniphila]MCL4079314.1 hypothetical protein [Parvivirga hydrogeniphila]